MEKSLEKVIFESISPEETQKIESTLPGFKLAVGLVARLRGPNGCPWDREQDPLTLRPYLIEEAYEVLDVIDQYQAKQNPKELAKKTDATQFVPANGSFSKEDSGKLCEELGDLLLQVILHAQLASERGEFTVGDVARNMAAKLVSRHPHVFGDAQAKNSDDVLKNWESLKKKEGKKGTLDGLPKNLPSLQRAARIGEKAHRVGFDWKDWEGSWEKVKEEIDELQEALDSKKESEIEHEIGDLFFALCNLSRHLSIQPEDAHRKAIARFETRFRMLEQKFDNAGKDMHSATLKELDEVWEEVKKELQKN